MAPENRLYRASHLCSLGPRPQIMTALFTLLLREHFAAADNIESAVFRERLYKGGADADSTGILIEDATVWTPTRTQKRPAIIVKRNGWKHIKRLTFNSVAQTTQEGHKEYTKLWRGSHTIFCIAPHGAEAEELTREVYQFLMRFGPLFLRYFLLLMFELMEVGELHRLEESTTGYVVPITVAYGWSESWIIRRHIPALPDSRLEEIFRTYQQ